jgi:hypothetical protein
VTSLSLAISVWVAMVLFLLQRAVETRFWHK